MKMYYVANAVGRHFGNLNVSAIRACLKAHKYVTIGTSNQKDLIEELRPHFPTNLIEIVGTIGVKIYETRN